MVPLRPVMTVRDVRRIIGSKMSARDTDEFCMYSLIAGKGWSGLIYFNIPYQV
jgi:hypothetical protein